MLRLRLARQTIPVAALLLAIAFAGEHRTHAQQMSDWTVSELSGEVVASRPNASYAPVALGDRFVEGSTIETRADGRIVLARGDTSMTLAPDSQIEIASDNETGLLTTIFQKIGTVLYKVEIHDRQHFEVDTPYLAALVKGTSFSIGVRDDGASTHVVQGAVEVRSLATGQAELVLPGQTATVSPANGSGVTISSGSGAASGSGDTVIVRDETTSSGTTLTSTLGETDIDIGAVTDGLASDGGSDTNLGDPIDEQDLSGPGTSTISIETAGDLGISDTTTISRTSNSIDGAISSPIVDRTSSPDGGGGSIAGEVSNKNGLNH